MVDTSSQGQTLRIAIIGDVHDQWDEQDTAALHHLQVDLALFVGDFGNEAVEVVRSIAALDLPKAAIMGNHDAWFTATPWGQRKCPYNRAQEDRVQAQLDLLGPVHVGYGKLDIPELGLTVVGGRPFSWGGSEWKYEGFYRDRYGINSFEESIACLQRAVDAAACDRLIFIGHCGPTGLGDRPESPCGRDWQPLGGDFGDPDLAAAIAYAQQRGKPVPLVAFGHMHHTLRHRKDILRQRTMQLNGSVYLNAACVPRIVKTGNLCERNFSLVTLAQGEVESASLIWLNQHFAITAEEDLMPPSVQPVSWQVTA